ncbi:hypothetical protein HDA32_004310 [Spinactinospora alkalitolerans]|uniref:Uncharacterized protein n=1 Tax=Spinactinospora alkalitolerans TaxID=687207 RepID=A0A852U5K4_9ACTN|nr:hypothetical protein [Spinactinospora alkalitolerans]NYE49190.1 hypothetical protein [Spinactinospora alkalitolerans]
MSRYRDRVGARGRGGTAVKIIRALAIALVVWIVGVLAGTLLVLNLATVDQMQDTAGRLGWIALPQLVVSFAMVLLAGFGYGRPGASRLLRDAVVLAPAAVQLIAVTVLGALGETPGIVVGGRLAAGAVGMGAAWWLLLRRDRRSR